MPRIQQIDEVLIGIYGNGLNLTGEPAELIRQAEARLGLCLPTLLREYYELTSHTDFVNSVQDRLLGPEDLEVKEGALAFYVESQGATYWGVLRDNFTIADPPVHRAWNDATMSWELDHGTLSEFFITMAYWQAVEGGLPNAGVGWADKRARSQIEEAWPELHKADSDELRVFGEDGVVLCLFGDVSGGPVHVGTRTADQLRNVEEMLDIEWDLIETDDA